MSDNRKYYYLKALLHERAPVRRILPQQDWEASHP